MKNTLILSVIAISMVMSSTAQATYIASAEDPGLKVRVTNNAEGRVIFESCRLKAKGFVCQAIGDADGYDQVTVAKRLSELESEGLRNYYMGAAIVVAATVIGLVRGAKLEASGWGPFVEPGRMLGSAVGGAILGSAVVALKSYAYDGSPVKAGADLNFTNTVSKLPENHQLNIRGSMKEFVKALNYALMENE